MNAEDFSKRTLPSDPQEAIKILAHELNRLNGQVAALLSYIGATDIMSSSPKEYLADQAHKNLPPLLFGQGPATYADHVTLTLSELQAKGRLR